MGINRNTAKDLIYTLTRLSMTSVRRCRRESPWTSARGGGSTRTESSCPRGNSSGKRERCGGGRSSDDHSSLTPRQTRQVRTSSWPRSSQAPSMSRIAPRRVTRTLTPPVITESSDNYMFWFKIHAATATLRVSIKTNPSCPLLPLNKISL